MGGQLHVFTVVHRHHDGAAGTAQDLVQALGDVAHDLHGRLIPLVDVRRGVVDMDVPAEPVWFLRSWSCSYRSKQKRQSRPDVGRSAFAGFIVLDFAAFHKGQFSQKETNKSLRT